LVAGGKAVLEPKGGGVHADGACERSKSAVNS
jgi:hypothetical protein